MNRVSGNGYLTQGINFGIGIISPASTDNLVEENTVTGNSNGIYLVAGTQGNTIRRNLVTGNPPVQISVDDPPSSGADIRNLATPGANTFENNTCLTSVNAPCPSIGVSFTANPNPIPVAGNALYGATTLDWLAPGVQAVEIHIGSPNGPHFAGEGNRGSAQTGTWVADGTTFYLQDVSGGNPLTSDHTLATLVVHLQRVGQASLLHRHLLLAGAGSVIPLLGVVLCGFWWRRRVGPKQGRI